MAPTGALVGAAAGGRFALNARAASKRDEQEFRLYKEEAIPDGIRRVALGQLEQAGDQLRGASQRDLEGAVHDARKAFKRLRATVRLARGAIGEGTYGRENTAFRDAGRRLSGVRDASVLVETVDELGKVCGDVLLAGATVGLRGQLEEERKQALGSLRGDDSRVAAVIADLELAHCGVDVRDPGLGRPRARAAADLPARTQGDAARAGGSVIREPA